MTNNQLAALAEHYAKTLMTTWSAESRVDYAFGFEDTSPEMTAADILEEHTALMDEALNLRDQTIAMAGCVDVIRDDGAHVMIPTSKLSASDIDTAMVCLAAQFRALRAEAHKVIHTFAGLNRIKEHAVKEAAQ
ncbi:hypothetical protein [Nonomuraea typhae]|uniref:hypothetical protein n=1 Tax=Nonomuraea typhae TaxID=2603600 RepID=UPI0012F76D52|nr:hypothetical protein [Nonomuraea typhae]